MKITIEGAQGEGKTETAHRLADMLRGEGYRITVDGRMISQPIYPGGNPVENPKIVEIVTVQEREKPKPATVQVKCANRRCGCTFTARVADRKRGWGRFCSKSCKAVRQEGRTGANAAYHAREERRELL